MIREKDDLYCQGNKQILCKHEHQDKLSKHTLAAHRGIKQSSDL